MRELLNTVVLNNPVSDYLLVFGFILLVLVLKKRASKNLTRLFFKGFRKMGKTINEKEFFDRVLSPLENFIFFLSAYLAFGSLNYPKAFRFKVLKLSAPELLDRLALGILIILFFYTLIRVIDYISVVMKNKADADQNSSDDQLIIFFREFLKVILIIICILVMIRFVLHQDITKLLAGLSIVGAAIALAAKESLENLIASFIIFFDKPFRVGDLLKVHQINGNVESIGLRSTRIRTADKTYVTIPNKQMVDSIVDNQSLRNRRRGELVLHIDLKTSVGEIQQLIIALEEKLRIKDVAEASVLLSEIRSDAYILTIEFFTELIQGAEFNLLKQQVNIAVLEVLETRNISLAGKDKLFGLSK
ncbi:MAG: mechanosensitive ion channel family protein [bacterium]|jgi:MscS family membrane protein